MSTSISIFANSTVTGKDEPVTSRIRKVWDYELYANPSTAYSLCIKTVDGDEVTLFLAMSQLESIGLAIDTFIASAVDPLPQPTINDLAKAQAESEQGYSLA